MSLHEREKAYRVALNHFIPFGALRTQNLLTEFGLAEAIWQASPEALSRTPKISRKLADEFISFRKEIEPEQLYEEIRSENIGCLFPGDPEYPELLQTIYDPPSVIYWQGNPQVWAYSHQALAMIGTRAPTPYGAEVARHLAKDFARNNILIVSGLALGIDAIAHHHVLDSGGPALAVLGSGLKQAAPRTNLGLFRRLSRDGLVISEYPPNLTARTWTFPVRNRIISGLSKGIIVIEASLKSGTMITVDAANEQGREVFAVPGSIFSKQSQGTHALIQQGAHLLTDFSEVYEALDWVLSAPIKQKSPPPINLTNDEQRVYVVLSEQPLHIDVLAEKIPQNPQEILSLLTILELKGVAEQLPGKLYKRKP